MSLKSLHAFVFCGTCVFLMSSYDRQEVRKCSSLSRWFCVQWLSSLGSQVCTWRPFSMARLCSLSLYLVFSFGHGCQANLLWFSVDYFHCTKYFSFCFLIIWFCLMCWLLCVGHSPRIRWLRGHFFGCNSLWVRALLWSVLLMLSF